MDQQSTKHIFKYIKDPSEIPGFLADFHRNNPNCKINYDIMEVNTDKIKEEVENRIEEYVILLTDLNPIKQQFFELFDIDLQKLILDNVHCIPLVMVRKIKTKLDQLMCKKLNSSDYDISQIIHQIINLDQLMLNDISSENIKLIGNTAKFMLYVVNSYLYQFSEIELSKLRRMIIITCDYDSRYRKKYENLMK